MAKDPYSAFDFTGGDQSIDPYAAFDFTDDEPDELMDGAEQLVRGINRGLHAIPALPGEIISGAASLMGFPETAEAFRLNNPVSRFMTSPDRQPQTRLGRFANASGQAIGASAIPMGTLMSQAPRLAARVPQTTGQAIKQRIAAPIAARPRAAIGIEAGSATTSGIGTQSAKESGYGPGIQTLAGIAGGIAPAAIGATVSGGVNQVRRAMANQGANGAYGKAANSLPTSVDEFAGGIAAGNRAASPNREIAFRVLGEEMVAANGNVQAAQAAAIPRIVAEAAAAGRAVLPSTAGRYLTMLRSMHRDSPLMLGEQSSVAGAENALRGPGGGMRRPQNVDVEALNRTQETGIQGQFDYLASSGNSPSAVDTRRALAIRGEGLAQTARSALEDVGPRAPGSQAPASIVDADNMIEQARQAGSLAYRAAYAAPIDNRLMLQTFPRILQRAERNARGRAGDKAAALNTAINQFYTDTPNGPVAMMTLQQLQDARGTLRGQIQGYRQAGRDDLVQAVQPLYRQVTRLMEAMSPQWAQANRQWADMSFDVMGRELGDAFAQRAGPRFRTQLQEFNNLHPEAQDIVRIHFLQSLYDKLDNLGDAHTVSKLFTSDHQRTAIRSLFGVNASNDITRIMRNVKTAEKSFAMNSRTHIRGQVKEEMEGDQGVEAARQMASLGGIKNWLAKQAHSLLVERRNKPLADIITTPMRDTPNVAMQVELMRAQQRRMRAFAQPRIGSQGLIGTSGSMTGNVTAQPYHEWLKSQ